MNQELCALIINVKLGINWYKVPMVGINGKLHETIQVSALWSITSTYHHVHIALTYFYL